MSNFKVGDRVRVKSSTNKLTQSALGDDVCPEDPASCGCVIGDVGVIKELDLEDPEWGPCCTLRLDRDEDPDAYAWWVALVDLEEVSQ